MSEEAVVEKEVGKKASPKVSEKLEGVLKTIEQLTVMELADLVKALEDKFGVSAAAAVAVAAPAGGGGGVAAPVAEEKDEFDIYLAEAGAKKIQVIKEIRSLTDLGLKEAKDLVESAPKLIKEGVKKEEAQKIKKILEEQGAKVELK